MKPVKAKTVTGWRKCNGNEKTFRTRENRHLRAKKEML